MAAAYIGVKGIRLTPDCTKVAIPVTIDLLGNRPCGQGSILLINHAIGTGIANPAQFNILDVFVDDQESFLEKPFLL